MPPQIYEDGMAFCSWRKQVCQFMCAWIQVLNTSTLQGTTLSRYIIWRERNINWNKYKCERYESPWYPTKWDHSNKHCA